MKNRQFELTPYDVRSLRGRASQLGIDLDKPEGVKRVEVVYGDPEDGNIKTLEVWNRPGKRISLSVWARLGEDCDHGVVSPDAANEALTLFGNKFFTDAALHKGKHPTIDLLTRIADREVPFAKVKVVNYRAPEVLPKDREELFKAIARKEGVELPAYVHFASDIIGQFEKFAAIPAPFGITVRYAMKANSVGYLLKMIQDLGGHFDASTFEEFERAEIAGVKPNRIRHTAAQVPTRTQLERIVRSGAEYTACSLLELENFGKAFPGHALGIRFNIGIASGWTPQTETGGAGSPFGIYQKTDEIKQILRKYNLNLKTFHYHIGSGADPGKQTGALSRAFEMIREFPSVDTVNVGGGVKIGRMEYDSETDIAALGGAMAKELKSFYKSTRRRIHLEIEPGTAMVAKSGNILTRVEDIIDNRPEGFEFIRLEGAGMNLCARQTMYGAEHPVIPIPMDCSRRAIREYSMFGDRCESGDGITPRAGQPETKDTRLMKRVKVGELAVIGATGAYGDSMAPQQYNSGIVPAVYFVTPDKRLVCARVRGNIRDITRRETWTSCGSLS